MQENIQPESENVHPSAAPSRHTSGPWRACKDGACACGQIFATDRETVVARAYGVADLEDYSADCVPSKDGQAANARLIAAAPAMLSALRAVEEWWLKEGIHPHTGAPYAIFATSEAIRKATGSDPR